MTAGLNVRIDVYRITEDVDDEHGGAIVTGTVLYDTVDARLQAIKPSPLLLQQGLEVDSLFRLMAQCSDRPYREYDEIEVTWPKQHKYYGERFRIIKVQEDALHPFDRRSFAEFTLSKMKYSRSNDLGQA
jgi:hypothetical protein